MATIVADAAPPRLLAQPGFLKLWSGLTLSLPGGQVSSVALPLTAALRLGASPFQMGLIGTLRWPPYLIFGLLAGVWLGQAIGLVPTIAVGAALSAASGLLLLRSPVVRLRTLEAALA